MTRPKKSKPRFAAIIVIVFGSLFALTGGGFTFISYSFSQTAIATSGVVTEVSVNRSSSSNNGSSSPTYKPTISFLDQNGTEQRAQTFLSSSSYNYSIGTKLRILYDPKDPSRLRINSWFAVWGFGLIFLVSGVLTMTGGAFFYHMASRKRPPKTVSITDESLAARKDAEEKKADYSYSSNEKRNRQPTIRRR